ncbi:sulfatase-like hydrolase/transferase, partial [Persicitalea sp.]|uniref:sulfatase-like hydrolase/transferase n=1 Tax=Persicitalea sp. TaxID=3100273 RepID=UPI003592EACB
MKNWVSTGWRWVLGLPLLLAGIPPEATLPPPNILWVTVEDISPMLGVYGDPNATTPHLDAFSKRSVRFTNAFATAPVCSPSRSCIITGYHGSSLGTQHLRSEASIPETIRPFPKYLREAGYFTSNNVKEDYNFIDNTIWDNSSRQAHWRQREEGKSFFSVFNLMLTHQSGIFGDDAQYEQRIKAFLPFITRTSPEAIQLPPYYPDTPEIRKLWARYYTNVSIVDYQFSQFLQELEEDGLSDNTIVFFYSDHGTGMPRHKRSLYDSGMKIPFMVHIPEKYAGKYPFKPGTLNNDFVTFLDLAPTVLDIAGIKLPAGYAGKPIFDSGEIKSREYIYGASDRVDEGFEMARSIRTKQYLYIRNYLPHLPLIQPNWYTDQSEIMRALTQARNSPDLTQAQKTMFAPTRPVEELYDVVRDPHQLHNLASEKRNAGLIRKMRKTLRQEILKNHDTAFAPEPELFRLSRGTTPFEFSQDRAKYPLPELMKVCDLMLKTDLTEKDLTPYLTHQNGLVRYWAVVAARQMDNTKNALKPQLQKLLRDEVPTVQIEAAKLLAEQGDTQGVNLIVSHLQSDDSPLVLYAARALQDLALRYGV